MKKQMIQSLTLLSALALLAGCSDTNSTTSSESSEAPSTAVEVDTSSSASSDSSSQKSSSSGSVSLTNSSRSSSSSQISQGSSEKLETQREGTASVSGNQGRESSQTSVANDLPQDTQNAVVSEAAPLIHQASDNVYKSSDYYLLPSEVDDSTVQIEVRRQAPEGQDADNLVATYRYNTSSGSLSEMDPLSGSWKDVTP